MKRPEVKSKGRPEIRSEWALYAGTWTYLGETSADVREEAVVDNPSRLVTTRPVRSACITSGETGLMWAAWAKFARTPPKVGRNRSRVNRNRIKLVELGEIRSNVAKFRTQLKIGQNRPKFGRRPSVVEIGPSLPEIGSNLIQLGHVRPGQRRTAFAKFARSRPKRVKINQKFDRNRSSSSPGGPQFGQHRQNLVDFGQKGVPPASETRGSHCLCSCLN